MRESLMARARKIEIKYECRPCSGTGLYRGFMEAKEEAVVCAYCEGRGYFIETAKEFEGRKKRKGVKKIRYGSGMILDDPQGLRWFSYAEFEERVPAPSS